jgi:hypothetical protein
MINELIKLATHLDKKGFHKEAGYLDASLKKYAEEADEEPQEDSEEKKASKWHKMKMTRVVEEMSKNDFESLTFQINGYNIRISKTRDSD